MDKDLKILIQQCQQNKNSAFENLYEKFSPVLFSVCLRYSNSYEDAQDLFQDGFIMIINKIDQFRFEGSFEGWMRRIMVNVCIEKHRGKSHLFVVNEEILSDEVEEYFDENQEFNEFSYDELLIIIRNLPDRYQQVFNLYVIEEFSHQEIAEMLNISVGTSKSNLSRAREKLKELIKKNKDIKIVSK